MIIFRRCTLKRLTWVLVLLSGTVLLNIWYMARVADVKFLIDRFQDLKLFQQLTYNNRILLWNSCEKLKGLDIQCPDYNCVFSVRSRESDINDLYLYTILFGPDVLNSHDRPVKRWEHQMYVFWSLVPPEQAPACRDNNDNFFNWTFTYRLDSKLVWTFFVVQNLSNSEMVAPNKTVKWQESHGPPSPYIKDLLNKKTKALAWVKTDCSSAHPGDSYIAALQSEISKEGLHFAEFDECTYLDPDDNENWKIIKEEEYYFLIAFEDYFAKDYVTNKVVRAYENYVVPIVYGGANYSWFLPPGSYLNANVTSPSALAHTIKQAVQNPNVYESFFKWTNLYYISAYPAGMHPLCNLCSALNNRTESTNGSSFRRWWNTPEGEKRCNEVMVN